MLFFWLSCHRQCVCGVCAYVFLFNPITKRIFWRQFYWIFITNTTTVTIIIIIIIKQPNRPHDWTFFAITAINILISMCIGQQSIILYETLWVVLVLFSFHFFADVNWEWCCEFCCLWDLKKARLSKTNLDIGTDTNTIRRIWEEIKKRKCGFYYHWIKNKR